MNVKELRQRYDAVAAADDMPARFAFLTELKASSTPDVLEFHYELLRDRADTLLFMMLRDAFAQRGDAAAEFLVARLKKEQDAAMRTDLLLMLGRMRRPEALDLARSSLKDANPQMREAAASVLGWLAKPTDIAGLGEAVSNDRIAAVRKAAATAHSQVHDRLPKQRNALLRNLRDALKTEGDDEVAGWIVVTVQYILKKRFGLKEDIDEGELVGDVGPARQKCLTALDKLKL